MDTDRLQSLDFAHDWSCAAPVRFSGVGVHTGADTTLTILPESRPGLRLRHKGNEIPVGPESVRLTRFCTGLGEVMTLEHVLAAVNGLGISAATLEVEGPEAPILDGSAAPFVDALLEAGIEVLPMRRRIWSMAAPWHWQEGDIRIELKPADELTIDYGIDFVRGEASLSQHRVFAWSPAAFATDIASARTFAFMADVEALRAQGLARGGSLENALVLGDRGEALNNLRFADEPIRHKILDCLGDLALLGGWLRARVTIRRGGHNAHVTMVKSLKEQALLVDERNR